MRVSIVICNYNYEAFLDDAIRSALGQHYEDKEVIVVDDGSTDGSRAVIARWHDRVVSIYQDNGGQTSAYNAGFLRVTGDVVIFLDSDDMLDANVCSSVVAAFSRGVVKVHYRLRLIDADGAVLGPTIPRRLAEGHLDGALLARGELYDSSPGSGNAYRVSALKRLMPIVCDPHDRHGADFFLVYGISLLGSIAVAGHGPLASYRVHSHHHDGELSFGNASSDVQEPARMYKRHERAARWVKERLGDEYELAPIASSFSLEKHRYVRAIFGTNSYGRGLRTGGALLVSHVLPSIARIEGSWALRAGLAAWALAVLALPRSVGRPIARYVSNPASR